MKFSGERAEPPFVITTTGTVPCPGGSLTVSVVQSGDVVRIVAEALPNITPVVLHRFVPLMTTVSPPWVGPLVGLMPETVGATT